MVSMETVELSPWQSYNDCSKVNAVVMQIRHVTIAKLKVMLQ